MFYLLISVILFLLILGIIIFFVYNQISKVNKNLGPGGTLSPDDPNNEIDSFAKNLNGIYLLYESDTDEKLFLKTRTNDADEYYYVGTCNDCPAGCQNAFGINDISTLVDCSDPQNFSLCCPSGTGNTGCVSTGFIEKKIKDKQDVLNEIQSVSKKNPKLTMNDCMYIINRQSGPTGTSTPSGDNGDDEDITNYLAMFGNDVKEMGTDLLDFFSKNSKQLIQIVSLMGLQKAIAQYIGHWSEFVFILPMLQNGQWTGAGIMSGFILSKFLLGRTEVEIKLLLQKALSNAAEKLESDAFTDLADDAVERIGVEMSTRIATSTAEEAGEMVTEALVEGVITEGLFEVVGVVQMFGMIMDMIDPCGLQNTVSQDDINKVSQAMDQLFYINIMNLGTYPAFFTAEQVPEYKFSCSNPDKIQDKNDPCYDFTKFTNDATNDYLNALTVNAYGQCIRNYTDQEIADFLTKLLGITVTADDIKSSKKIMTDTKSVQSSINKLLKVYSLSLADNNIIIADYIYKYWYIVLILLFVIILIAILIK